MYSPMLSLAHSVYQQRKTAIQKILNFFGVGKEVEIPGHPNTEAVHPKDSQHEKPNNIYTPNR